jgi:signal transduction histidine kinase
MGFEGLPSFVAMVVELIFALLAHFLSRGPDSGHLKWFARASLSAAVFSGCNAFLGMEVTDAVRVWASRTSYMASSLFGAAWMHYLVGEERRELPRSERLFVTAFLVMGLSCLVPDLAISGAVARREAWWGLVYRDAVPTQIGQAYTLVLMAILCWSAWRAVQWMRARRDGGWALLAVSLFAVAAGLNDSLAFVGLTRAPYLLDISFFTFTFVAGLRVAQRFVENAQALKQTGERLVEAQSELVKRERLAALGELSATVAHEVRTPVAVIFNVLPALRRELGAAGPDAQSLLDMLGEEADRLRRLVDDLLDFVRPISPRPVQVPLGPLVHEAVEAARAARSEGTTARIHVEGDAGELWCDPHLLHRVFTNLLGNALEAGASEVRIRCRDEGARVLVDVVDRGRGVKPGDEARLFRPFFTTRPSGTGLGLSVVQRILEAHGGTVHYAPTPGGGATFTCTLPRRAHAAAA